MTRAAGPARRLRALWRRATPRREVAADRAADRAARPDAGRVAAEPGRAPTGQLRAANRTILLVAGLATVVQSAGAVGESPAQVAVAGVGVALAVFAVWLQLSTRSWNPSLVVQLAASLWLASCCYLVVFVAGVVTAGSDTYRYDSGVRPEERTSFTGLKGAPTRTSEWTLDAGARVDTVFRRTRRSTRDPASLSGWLSVGSSCGRVDWTLSAGDRPLARGTIDATAGRRSVAVALAGPARSDPIRLTLARADAQPCAATVSSSRWTAVGRPSIPLPGLDRYLHRAEGR